MHFAIIARDAKDTKALQRRLASREAHLTNVKARYQQGHIVTAGAMLNEKDEMNGSIIFCNFADKAAVEAFIANDPYYKNKVWQDIEILPIRLLGKEQLESV